MELPEPIGVCEKHMLPVRDATERRTVSVFTDLPEEEHADLVFESGSQAKPKPNPERRLSTVNDADHPEPARRHDIW